MNAVASTDMTLKEFPKTLKKAGLVLSGGGARCLAHIGVLKALEERGVSVSAISGTSTGAVLGALYASGVEADALYHLTAEVDWGKFVNLGAAGGLSSHEGLMTFLSAHLPETFESLKLPLAVATVDIQSGELLVLSRGALLPAVCASNAFPGLYAPVEHLGRHLMDGGILDNFPVDIIRPLTQDPIVAVDVTPSASAAVDINGEAGGGETSGALKSAKRLLGTLTGQVTPSPPPFVSLLKKAYTITQSRLIDVTTTLHPPDHLIRPALPDDLDLQSFGRLEEAYRCGYEAADQWLASLGQDK